jgi:hypothetical protein
MINEYAFPIVRVKKRTNTEFLSVLCYVKYYKLRYHILFFTADKTRLYVYAIGVYIIIWIVPRFSHIIHIHSSIQTNTIHVITYFINFCFNGIYNFTKTLPSNSFMCILLLLILFDIFALINLSLIFFILSQTFIFISLLIYYYPLLPKNFTDKLYLIVLTILAILILILNEIYNGNAMMAMYPDIPFHCLVEIFIYLFYNICSIFYNL